MRPVGKHAVFRPLLFLSFSYPGTAPDSSRFHVAVGHMFSRFRRAPRREMIPKEDNSGLIVLAKEPKLEAVGIDSFIAPIHLVPYFSTIEFDDDSAEEDEDEEDSSDRGIVHDCDLWLLNEFVDREVFHMVCQPHWQFSLQ